MSSETSSVANRIVMGVTASQSLGLMQGLPEFLASKGWEVHVVSGPGEKLAKLREGEIVKVHPIDMKREPSIIRDIFSLIGWVRVIASVQPDVVMAGTPKAGLLGMVASAIMRVPNRIYHVRGLRLETTSGFSRAVFTAIEKLACHLCTSVVAVSESLRARLIELKLAALDKVVVLGNGSSNGVDVEQYRPSRDRGNADGVGLRACEYDIKPGVPVVGYVGRLTRDKGISVLLQASKLLERREVDHQLLFIGRAEQNSVLAEINEHRETSANTIVVGPIENVAPLYQFMDVFCLPTYREGFPNVVLEAASSGLPVVTTDATGAVDSIIDGETGVLTKAGDSKSLANGLQRLILDSRERARMAVNAREFTLRNFSRGRVWENLAIFLSENVR